ncbi:hypothetical protein EFK50_14645 [Nocardioides marmoriginsengisoli]|uniref:LPXTG cell wall anchor domain-containing protein n=1 Tax=Nocardioides marmoriginsengisoli TaxID=661483 RepID=A0A3N0CHN0_9ACTN|nr:hypothetical protein [Nocardioides marmoriginsengisoli]RNL62960.1 hypothetical protein EFK50_14645 [Nocardioides marmoriginsengisoli]
MTRACGAALVAVSLVLVALCWVLAAPAPASAEGEAVVSTDGVTWTDALTTPLFSPATRWAPGDTRVSSFLVGNRASVRADLAVRVRTEDPDGLVARGDVDLAVRSGTGAWRPLPADGQPHRLPGVVLAAGANDRISVRARFRPASPNRSQLQRLPLTFEVVLSQAGTAAPPGTGTPGLLPGVLPETGGAGLRVLVVGLLLTLLGFLTTLIAARRKDDHDDRHLA